MNKNLLINVILAISAAFFVFMLMLLAYLNSQSPEEYVSQPERLQKVELEYSFTEISENSVLFNTTETIAKTNPFLFCEEDIEVNIVSKATVITGLSENTNYSCVLSINENEYPLVGFTTLAKIFAEEYGLAGYQSIDDNSGRVVRLRWELNEYVILTRSALDEEGELLAQEEFLVENNNYTDRISEENSLYTLQYEIRRSVSPNIFSAVTISPEEEGQFENDPRLDTKRIASEGFQISNTPLEVGNIEEYYIFEKVNGVLLLANKFSGGLSINYALPKSGGSLIYPAVELANKKYMLSGSDLYGDILFVSGEIQDGAKVRIMYENGVTEELPISKGKVELKEVLPSILVFNGLDRYVRVYQRVSELEENWDSNLNSLSWKEVPGALFYTVEAYGGGQNQLGRYTTVAPRILLEDLDYEEEITLKVSYTSSNGKSILGETTVRLNPEKIQIKNFSIAKMDNRILASWDANPDEIYLLEISREGSSVWNSLRETEIGQSEVSIRNVDRLNPGTYNLRMSSVDKEKPPVYTISNCNLVVSADKTFRIVCE